MPTSLDELRRVKDQIRSKADIVEVVGKLVSLTRKGPAWKGLCPFHSDRKPSLTVSDTHANYRCWSCGATGDVFTFVEATEGLSFMEALETLAERFGVPYERRGITDEALSGRQRSLQILAQAEEYFCSKLGKEAEAYLTHMRGINRDSIKAWGIGYAPDSSVEFRTKMNALPQDLIAAGLMRQSEDGRSYRVFNDRIVFPIRDIHGTTIGFGGRAMGDAQPKYINSPQSAVFNKSSVLYGLDKARKNKPDSILIVEGYLDVILAHQSCGPDANAVAPMGTALTEQHAKMLAPITQKVILGYDADQAGRTAASKSYVVLKSYDIDVRIATFPDGEDPASLLIGGAGGTQKMNKFFTCLSNAKPYIDFQLDQIAMHHSSLTQAGRTAALAEMIPVLASIENSAELGAQVINIAEWHPLFKFGQQGAVQGILRDIQACRWKTAQNIRPSNKALLMSATTVKPTKVDDPDCVPISRAVRLERALLSGMFDPWTRSIVVAVLNPQHLITPEGSLLYQAMLRFPTEDDGALDWNKFLEHIRKRCRNALNVINYLEGLFHTITQELITPDILRECAQYLAAIHKDMSDRLAATSLASMCMEGGI